jgi:hypothetical protein
MSIGTDAFGFIEGLANTSSMFRRRAEERESEEYVKSFKVCCSGILSYYHLKILFFS